MSETILTEKVSSVLICGYIRETYESKFNKRIIPDIQKICVKYFYTQPKWDFSREKKIMVNGGASIGKSSLVVRYVTGYFVDDIDPTIELIY